MDWSLVQTFLAVAETGSLSAAARKIGTSQPTLGRHIKALETQLGATLFHRQARGFALTDTGSALIEPAKAMRDAMQQIALRAAGEQQSLKGTVRITASIAVSAFHLPDIIADLRNAEPDISVELVPSDETGNLLYREADIAVRMYRPTQLDLVTKHVGDLELGVFAAKSYLQTNGYPTPDTIWTHAFVGYDRNSTILEGMRGSGLNIDREFFQTRCDDPLVYWQLVRAGCGIGFAQNKMGQGDPLVEPLEVDFPLPTLPIWLTAHEAMRQTPRVLRVWDALSDHLKTLTAKN